MEKIIISDASCLILLKKIGQLELLQKIYGEIIIPPKVAAEYGEDLPDWITVRPPQKNSLIRLLEEVVDAGEASAIALAVELGNCYLILDDKKGRELAASMELEYTGTLGVIIVAKELAVIPAVKPIFLEILKTDFRVSQSLIEQILIEVGEE